MAEMNIQRNNYHTKMMKYLYTVLLLVIITSYSYGRDIIFHSERIEFELFANRCEVTGYYTFRNDKPDQLQQTLLYPFPEKDGLPFPSSISLTDINETPIPFERGAQEIIFPLIVPGESSQTYIIHYSQPAPGHFIEYILNTTMQWHFPLTSAEFVVIVPKDITCESISMSDYEISNKDGKTIYRIYRENFRTDKNLIIKWSKK